MEVAVFGTGYVGLVTGACLAEIGHQVVCVDVDEARVALLSRGGVPFHEPGLAPLVRRNHGAGRLSFTTDPGSAVAHGAIVFIAVGTPAAADGSADVQYVLAAARTIGAHLAREALVVVKSTVPVGTGDRVRDEIGTTLAARRVDVAFEVASNPEFLTEGAAVADFMKPDRIIVGARGPAPVDTLRRLYAPLNRNRDRVLAMDVRSAELAKYAANAMLATRISFMNEMAAIAGKVGADVEMVRQGIGSDPRIGWHYLYPGAGYGGSCLPKDVRALAAIARGRGCEARLLDAVEAVNDAQKDHLATLVARHYGVAEALRGRTFAVWGLAFKPDTDDLREAPSRRLLEALWQAGARVRAYDPAAGDVARKVFGSRDDLAVCDSAEAALEGADALVVVTEWKQFRSPDPAALARCLGDRVVFDGRNLYDPALFESAGLAYYGIGRGRSIEATA